MENIPHKPQVGPAKKYSSRQTIMLVNQTNQGAHLFEHV